MEKWRAFTPSNSNNKKKKKKKKKKEKEKRRKKKSVNKLIKRKLVFKRIFLFFQVNQKNSLQCASKEAYF